MFITHVMPKARCAQRPMHKLCIGVWIHLPDQVIPLWREFAYLLVLQPSKSMKNCPSGLRHKLSCENFVGGVTAIEQDNG